jgi:hypothetical protein
MTHRWRLDRVIATFFLGLDWHYTARRIDCISKIQGVNKGKEKAVRMEKDTCVSNLQRIYIWLSGQKIKTRGMEGLVTDKHSYGE